MKFPLNGQIYEAPYPLCHTVIVQYLGEEDKWILLSSPDKATHNGTCMMVCHYERKFGTWKGTYHPIYTQEELGKKLKSWKLTTDKLLLLNEKTYPEYYR